MTKYFYFLTFLPFLLISQSTKPIYESYIQKFKTVAAVEMKRKGIPSSIKLGQAILESNAGTSVLSICSQNHFGIKCGGDWNGTTCFQEDDDFGPDSVLIKSCFRAFGTPEESFVAHSDFLTNPNKINRYGFLFQLDPKDYKSWAYGLLRAGYCTNPNYPEILIKIIEDYKLYELDNPEITKESITKSILENNKLQMLVINQQLSLNQIAKVLDISPEKMLKYNEQLAIGLDSPLPLNSKLYLEKKNRYWHGDEKYHTVSKGETMYTIAQNYGMRLERLYKKNRMPLESQPLEGEKLKIGFCYISKKEIPRYYFPKEQLKDSTQHITTKDTTSLDFEITPNVVKVDSIVGKSKVEMPKGDEKILKENTEIETDKPESNIEPIEKSIGFHIVLSGETLYSISRKHNISVVMLKQLNNILENKIVVGQKLKLK
jgi:LysM repeat protein